MIVACDGCGMEQTLDSRYKGGMAHDCPGAVDGYSQFHPVVPWIWNPRQRAFVLPRNARLPKRPRRLARQKLREDA